MRHRLSISTNVGARRHFTEVSAIVSPSCRGSSSRKGGNRMAAAVEAGQYSCVPLFVKSSALSVASFPLCDGFPPAREAQGPADRTARKRHHGGRAEAHGGGVGGAATGGGGGNRTRVKGFADPCLSHSATPPRTVRDTRRRPRLPLHLCRFPRRNTDMAPDTGPAVALSGVRRTFGDVVAVDDLTFEVPRGTVTVLLGPNGAGKTTVVRLVTGALHSHAGAVRTLGLDPDDRRRGHRGPPPLRRGPGPARALRPPVRHRQPRRTRPRCSRSIPRLVDERIAEAAAALRHRRRARPEGRRLLDRHARPPRAGPRRAPRARPAAARRADRRPRPRVGPHRARPHRRDGRGRQDRPHVHAPPARGRGPRRPGDRDGPRAGDDLGLAARAHPPVLARGTRRARRRRPRAARHRAGRSRSCAPTTATASRPSSSSNETDVPDLVDALVGAGARLTRVEPQAPSLEELYFAIRQEHSVSRRTVQPPAAPVVGDRRAPTCASCCRRATSGCR